MQLLVPRFGSWFVQEVAAGTKQLAAVLAGHVVSFGAACGGLFGVWQACVAFFLAGAEY
jgi:hypothetical protein